MPDDPDLSPPTEELKLVGRPDPLPGHGGAQRYPVRVALSRKLSAGEQDAAGHGAEFPTEIGTAVVDDDLQHLIVSNTTIEYVIEHHLILRNLVDKIAGDGERYRQRALAAREQTAKDDAAQESEETRRRKLADGFSFD
jgi:hypothetical protein